MTNKNKIVIHLFYEQSTGIGYKKTVISILLFNTDYDMIPKTIDKIVMEYYNTCSYHEIHSIIAIKDQIYINGGLI
jgi:hypothetical protein